MKHSPHVNHQSGPAPDFHFLVAETWRQVPGFTHGHSMIRHFYIDNFKYLVDFALPTDMGQFTCIVGLNGSGSRSS